MHDAAALSLRFDLIFWSWDREKFVLLVMTMPLLRAYAASSDAQPDNQIFAHQRFSKR
jgi:hypothetical protein